MTLAVRTTTVLDSPLRRWDARWKLGGLVLLSAGTAAATRPGPAAAGLGVGLLVCGLGRVPGRDVLARAGLLLVSAGPLLVLLPFTADGPTAAATALRLVAVGLVGLALARSTPVTALFAAFGAVGVPAGLVTVALLAHRYALLFAGELVRLRRAWRVRGFRLATGRHAYRTAGAAVGALAVRGDERAGRVLTAMRARGFAGVVRPLDPFRTRPADVLGFLACAVAAGGLVAADRLPPATTTTRPGVGLGTPHPALVTRSLAHTFPDGRPGLRGVTLTVPVGERVAVVGANGAGKTTLLLRLCGALPGERGQAEVNGLDPADPADRAKLPAAVGVVFQNPDDQLFAATVLEDVAFGPLNLGAGPADARQTAEAALERVGLTGYGERSPHRLSGGEKRRAALAGVLAMHPPVLLLDEPTAFLDPRGRRQLVALLAGLPGTLLVATHDRDLAVGLCTRAVVLDDGRVVADGPAAVLLTDPGLAAAYDL